MIPLHIVGHEPPALQHAILVYQGPNNSIAHVAVHGITASNQIDPKPQRLARRSLAAGLQALLGRTATSSFKLASPHLLAASVDTASVIWWRPAGPTPMFFADGVHLGDAPARSGMVDFPATVWKYDDGAIRIAAIEGRDRRPTAATPLFHSALFNVNDAGELCHGSIQRVQPGDLAHAHKDVENAVLRGLSTHATGQARKCLHPQGWLSMIAQQIANPELAFEDAWLAPMRGNTGAQLTLADWGMPS